MENKPVNPLDANQLRQIFIHNLNRLYFGKCYLSEKMAHLIKMASFRALQMALAETWDDANKQITRMEEIFVLINEIPFDEHANAIKSIVKDEFCLNEATGISILKDTDIILYVQILEHINITAYRLLKMTAPLLNNKEIEQLLKECFDESVDDDQLFVLITKEYIN